VIINDLIIKQAQNNPHKLFCNIDNQSISYLLFNDYVEQMQIIIRSAVKSEIKIGLNFNKKIFLLSSIIACNREKAIPVVLPSLENHVPNFDYKKASGFDFELNDNNCIIQDKKEIMPKSYRYEGNASQCILFSSGTEGFPKAVELSFSNIYYSATGWNHVLDFSKNSSYLNVLPLHHVSGLSIFFRSIYCDFSVYYKKYSSLNILRDIDKTKADYLSVVPKILYDIMKNSNGILMLSKLKLLIIGGDAINKDMFDYLNKSKINSYVSYGMTETASGIAGYFIKNQSFFDINYLGNPHRHVKIKLSDSKKIIIKSKMVFKNYVGESYNDNFFMTNDIGEIKNNKVFYKSRGGEMIVSGGENINLLTIKNALSEWKSSFRSIVVIYNDLEWGEIPIVVYKETNKDQLIENLKQHCQNILPKFMVPKHFIGLDVIPLLSNKKPNLHLINDIIKNHLS